MEAQRQDPNLFCMNRRKDWAPRAFESCMSSLRCRVEGFATGLDGQISRHRSIWNTGNLVQTLCKTAREGTHLKRHGLAV
jgi:hypothetical protein